MKSIFCAVTLVSALMAGSAFALDEATMKELTPTGKLRVGIVFAPAPSALFASKDAQGQPHGVTVDLSNELATKLGAPVEFTLLPNTGLATDGLEAGTIDVSFMPVDEERKKRVAFGPSYFTIESTYMVTAASGMKTVSDVDRAGARVFGIANTTTIRAATRTLKNTTIAPVPSVGEAVDMMKAGKADAFALSRDSLPPFVAQVPNSLIVGGGFQQTGVAVAVGKDKPLALAFVSAFLEDAKKSGGVRRALDKAGFDVPVAPPSN